MKYSIIIPVYNAEKCICKCLDSVFEQTSKDYEIILVNDGSTDSSEEVIKEYIIKKNTEKVHYIKQENKGPAAARAKGIENAKGRYIAFLDADDIWYPNKLEYVDRIIEKENATFIYHNERMVLPNGKRKKSGYYRIGNRSLEDLLLKGNPISTSTVVVESELLKANHTFSDGIEYGEDIACWIELAKAGAVFSYIETPLGEYRRMETSLTLSNEQYLINTGKRLIEFYDYLEFYGYTKERIKQLKLLQVSKNEYNIGRYYHKRGDFGLAKQNYIASYKKERSLKKLTGYLLALMHIRY